MSEWQECPLCLGVGIVAGGYFYSFLRAGDYGNWASGNTFEQCRICEGKGIIARPPSEEPPEEAPNV